MQNLQSKAAMTRRIGSKDYSDYLDIRIQSLADSPTAFGMSVDEAPSVEKNNFEENTAEPNAIFLSYDESKPCGVVGVRRSKGVKRQHIALIWGMYVTPSERQKSIGQLLMAQALKFAKESGVEKLQLSVNAENSIAFRLYEKLGFQHFGTEKNALKLEGQYFDEHLMELFL